jgi:hypothetical protein
MTPHDFEVLFARLFLSFAYTIFLFHLVLNSNELLRMLFAYRPRRAELASMQAIVNFAFLLSVTCAVLVVIL